MSFKVPVSHFAAPGVAETFRSGQFGKLVVRPKIAFHLLRLLRRIDEEIANYEQARLSAFRQYGEEKGEGGEKRLEVLPERQQEFFAAMEELHRSEVEFALDKIPLSALGDDVKLSAADLLALEPFLDTAEGGSPA
jgi:hypothetical protein